MRLINSKFKASNLFKSFLIISIILIIITSNITVLAEEIDIPKPTEEFYVYDEANLLASSTENLIISVNEEMFRKTGAQVVVSIVNSLQDRSIEEFANRMFREWGIGGKEKNNGLLILIAPNEKKVRLEVGYGLEGAIPDGKAGRIRDDYLIPALQIGDYDTGVKNAFSELVTFIEEEYNINIDNQGGYSGNRYSTEDQSTQEESPISIIRKIIIGIIIVILIIIDMIFFRGFFTFMILRMVARGGRGGNDGNSGGGGSSGGGGASGGW